MSFFSSNREKASGFGPWLSWSEFSPFLAWRGPWLGLLPSRVFDPLDMLRIALANLMVVLASLALAWARRRGGKAGFA